MAAELFVDTSGWFPIADPKDRSHDAMASALRDAVQRKRPIVTTNLVVAETHALIMRRFSPAAALTFLKEVVRAPLVVVTSTPEHQEAAQREWLERYYDQDFSLTDAVSFSVMAERGIREVLALDHHFAIAGFNILPATSPERGLQRPKRRSS